MSELGRTAGGLSPLRACMVPSGTIKANPQEEIFKLVPAQGSLLPVSEVHGVLSNGVLTSTSRG